METEKAEKKLRKVSTRSGHKEYTYLGCPLTRNRAAWCFRLCAPNPEGKGRCGRVAPHGLRGHIAESIERFNERQAQVHYTKLEHAYLKAPASEYYDPGVSISEGEAEVVVEIQEKFLAGGAVHDSVGYTAMRDAAALAVNSIVEDILIAATDFQVQFSRPVAKGQLVAHARVMGVSGEHYLAEAVLADADGTEVARGNGAFLPTETALSPEIGYE